MKHILEMKRLNNVLDIGVGESGRWGFLLRDICDGTIKGRKFSDKTTWHLRITGIEAYEKYHNFMHDQIYDKMYWCDAFKALEEIGCRACDPRFDLVLFMATIEHFEKEDGMRFLRELKIHINIRGTLIITTPNGYSKQDNVAYENPYDHHKCGWTEEDIPAVVAMGYELVDKQITYDNRLIMVFMVR
jgi:hypothetical protein